MPPPTGQLLFPEVSQPPRDPSQNAAPQPRREQNWQRPGGAPRRGGYDRRPRGRAPRLPPPATNHGPRVRRDQLQALRVASGRLLQELGYRHLLEWTREKVIIDEVEQWREASPPSLQKATLEILDLHGKVPQEAKGLLDSSTGDLLAVCFGKGRGVMREVTYDILLPQGSGKVFLGEAGQTKDRPEPAVGLFARAEFVPNWFRMAGRLDRDAIPPPRPAPAVVPQNPPIVHQATSHAPPHQTHPPRETAWRDRRPNPPRQEAARREYQPRVDPRPQPVRPPPPIVAAPPAPSAPAPTGKVSLMAIPAEVMERLRNAAKARGVTPLEWVKMKLDGR